MTCMRCHTSSDRSFDRGVDLCSTCFQEINRQYDVCRTDPDVHRAEPIDTEARRISRQEIDNLISYFSPIDNRLAKPGAAFGCQKMSDRELRQMLQSGQFPRYFDVCASDIAITQITKMTPAIPAKPRLEVDLPIDRFVGAVDET